MKIENLLTKTLLVAAGLCVGASNAWAEVTAFSESYTSTSTIDGWSTSNSGRFDPVILSENENYYLSVTQANRNNNGATVTGTVVSGKAAAGDNFTITFDLKVSSHSDSGKSGAVFTIYDAANSSAIFSLTDAGSWSTDWAINGTSTKVTLPNSNKAGGSNTIADVTWCSYKITRSGSYTYLTITNTSTSEVIFSQSAITGSSATGGLGNITFASSRYLANFAIDNIVVREVQEGDVPAVTYYNYTIKAVSGETTLSTFTEGVAAAGATYGTYIPKYVYYNSQYYVLDDADITNYYPSYTMGTADEVKEIEYTLDESIQAFWECENLSYVGHSFFNTASDNSSLSAGAGVTTYGGTSNGIICSTTIGKGIYTITVNAVNWNTDYADSFYLQYSTDNENWTTLATLSWAKAEDGEKSATSLVIPGDAYIRLLNTSGTTPRHYLDYIVADKTGDVETKTITAAGYATYCSTNALDFSSVDGLTAYQITGASGSSLTLEEITGTVAANTGILLAGAAGSYTIPVVASGTDYSSTNKLVGVTAETAKAAGTIYVLMDETAGVGFYKNNNAFTVGAHTAYLNASDFTSAREFFLFTETNTGINKVESGKLNVEGYYNLNGQRVAQPTKGLYIMNGKKVLVP